MPKRTLVQVLSQIDALQREAEQLRTAEVKGVIARIHEAIEHYGLTPEDLFPAARRRGRPPKASEPTAERVKPTRRRKASSSKRGPGAPKYADPAGSGKTWTGQGKRPGWFVAAVESGKQAEDLLIK